MIVHTIIQVALFPRFLLWPDMTSLVVGQNQLCGVFNSALGTGYWQSLSCDSALPYICKKTPNISRTAEPIGNKPDFSIQLYPIHPSDISIHPIIHIRSICPSINSSIQTHQIPLFFIFPSINPSIQPTTSYSSIHPCRYSTIYSIIHLIDLSTIDV